MNQLLEEHFSCNEWLLVNQELLPKFLEHFNFIQSNELIKWKDYNNYHDNSDHNEILIPPSINNYCIIEGNSIGEFYRDYCDFFSQRDEVAYRCKIDIWIPVMIFECYKNEKLIRYYECSLDIEQSEIREKESGEKLAVEKKIDLPVPENGYDYFYYPLAVMKNLKITPNDLSKLIKSECKIFKQNN